MKKIFLFLLLAFSFYQTSWSQLPGRPPAEVNIPRQSVFLELGGNGLIYSLNYDVLFPSNWGFRLGGSFFPADFSDSEIIGGHKENSQAFFGIIMGQRSFGESNHKLELGAGLLYGTIYDDSRWDYIEPPGFTTSIGYRYFPEKAGNVTSKAAFTPVITKTGFHPRIGISLGVVLSGTGKTNEP